MAPANDKTPDTRRRDWLTAAALAAVTLGVFWPSLECGFVNIDDPISVRDLAIVTNGLSFEGCGWAFSTFRLGNWHPLTWLSLQLNADLARAVGAKATEARPYHLGNIVVHSANAVLLFLALRALTGAYWRSLAVAVLFAVHPLRVESVVWISERKDVLSIFFGLLALMAYVAFTRRPGLWRYLVLLIAFVASLLSKATLVTLPCLLLVLDWWPLQRIRVQDAAACGAGDRPVSGMTPTTSPAAGAIRRLVLEKLPLVAVAIVFSLVAIEAQASRGAPVNWKEYPLPGRIENAIDGYVFYMMKTLWPTNLAAYYPHPLSMAGSGIAHGQTVACLLVLTVLTAAAVFLRRQAPYFLAGWLWFLGTLVPTIGILQVGTQAYADRYSYFPQIGLFIAICWGMADLFGRRAPVAAALATTVAGAALAVVTWKQISVWHDDLVLWTNARQVTGANFVNLSYIGEYWSEQPDPRDRAKAEAFFQRAVEMSPNALDAHLGLGNLYYRQGKMTEAARELGITCKIQPNYPITRARYGLALYALGKMEEAEREQEAAIQIAPEMPEPHRNLGQIALAKRDYQRAVSEYRAALRLSRGAFDAHLGLGVALVPLGAYDEAMQHLKTAVKLEPDSEQAYYQLGIACMATGALDDAAAYMEHAIRLAPARARDWYSLSEIRRGQGRPQEADQLLRRAQQLDPALRPNRESTELRKRAP